MGGCSTTLGRSAVAALAAVATTLCGVSAAQEPTPTPAQPRTTIVGSIVSVPAVPNPRHNPYPDCVLLVEVEVLERVSGDALPAKVMVGFLGFKDRTLLPAAAFNPGDHLRLELIPFDRLDEKTLSIQRIGESEDLEVPVYWAEKFEPIKAEGK